MLSSSSRFGPYVIISPLGAGGMGEVYLAEDTRLKRRVALKVLPTSLASDERAQKRLLREAQSAATLDHPNICTVYEVGEADGHGFIAMQYVEGDTLAARLKRGPLDFDSAVGIAREVARALAEAHRHGIIHRDIKPQNIMIARSGQVKVLDFGLAKAVTPFDNDAVTASRLTEAGAVAGTVPYMSPEQARGEDVDERSDVFSFGSVLYEMIGRRHPFSSGTGADTVSMILMRDPPPLESGVAPEVRRIIQKCLAKDRARRYQTVSDLVIDLEALTPEGVPTAPVAGATAPARRSAPLVWIAAAAIALALGLLIWWQLAGRTATAPAPAELQQVTALADAASGPALSPDGRMVAFFRDPGLFLVRGDVYVKLLPNGDAVQLTHDPRPKYGLTFSPDSTRVAYTVIEDVGGRAQWSTWTVPVVGGQAPSRLLPNAAGLKWIDDRHVLYSEVEGSGLHMGLVTATETRQDRRVLYFPAHERAMAHYSALSPDRKNVLVVEMNKAGGWEMCRVLAFDGSSTGRQVGPEGECRAAAWSPRGDWMYFTVEAAGTSHLWRQRFPDGAPEELTTGPGTNEQGVAVDPDGRSVITSVGRRAGSIWLHDAGGDRLLSSEGFASQPRLSADGKRVYYLLQRTAASAVPELAVMDLETGKTDPLLPGFSIVQYRVSRDDRDALIATTGKGETRQIWLVSLDRRQSPRLLVEGGDRPVFGPGEEVMFRSLEGQSNFLDRINRDGTGRARVLAAPIIDLLAGSPDGEWVTARVSEKASDMQSDQVAVRIRDGAMHSLCHVFCSTYWSSDRKYLAIAMTPLRTPTLVVPLPAGQIFPPFPADGSAAASAWMKLPGAQLLDAADIVPIVGASKYLFTKGDNLRNLFRVPIR